jgi:hypothetical protein
MRSTALVVGALSGETSLEDNEKVPEASWDSEGRYVMTNKTVARGEEKELEMQTGPIRVP